MPRHLIFLLLISIHVASCSLVENSGQNLDFEIRTIDYTSANCEPERDACLMVDIAYPEFIAGDSLAQYLANRIIRNSTLDFLGLGDVEAAVTPELNSAVVTLDSAFQKLKNEAGTATGWQAQINIGEIYRNDSLLVLEASMMSYFGGAHGLASIRYFNFDRQTGRLVPLSKFVDLNSFTPKAESYFKEKYLEGGQSYAAAGFNFLGDQYVLPANYAIKGDSILLHYNHYEIAPYAAGQFDVAVPVD